MLPIYSGLVDFHEILLSESINEVVPRRSERSALESMSCFNRPGKGHTFLMFIKDIALACVR